MRIFELTATAHPEGNRILLSWRPDRTVEYDHVRVVRRTVAYPESAEPQLLSQGLVIADSRKPNEVIHQPGGRIQVIDAPLVDGTVYYYQVFPYRVRSDKREYEDPLLNRVANRVSVAATGKHGFPERMYGLLPEIYRRFDTDRQLRDFLTIIGGQLDQMYSAVRSIPELKDVATVDGNLLPLLAEWIGWRTDHSAGFERQRFDLSGAVRLYQANQTLAAVQAGVRRVTGWDNVCKEFVDNVAITNSPERHNLWLVVPGEEPGDQPLSFDEMFASRPAVSAIGDRLVMIHATNRSGPSEICQKEHVNGRWQSSTTVVAREGVEREPSIVWRQADGSLWLFWATLSSDAGWGIEFRSRLDGGAWSTIRRFTDEAGDPVQRRSPALLMDEDDGLWVFWRELVGDQWTLRYQRFTGAELDDPTPNGATTFPVDDEAEPRVESDLFVLHCRPEAGAPRILVLWARRGEQRCWRVAARVKGTTSKADDWGPIVELPGSPGSHDREPAAYFTPAKKADPLVEGSVATPEKLVAYFSSTRDGSWSIWNVDMDPATALPGIPTAMTGPPYSDRAPVAFNVDDEGVVVYRSSRPPKYRNLQYAATTAEDIRYCGNTTLRTGNGDQITKMGGEFDFTAYTYDAGRAGDRNDGNLISRDTLGIFIKTPNIDQVALAAGRRRLDDVLGEFLPATTRAVVIPDKDLT